MEILLVVGLVLICAVGVLVVVLRPATGGDTQLLVTVAALKADLARIEVQLRADFQVNRDASLQEAKENRVEQRRENSSMKLANF